MIELNRIDLHGLEGISGIKERYTAYKKLWKEKNFSLRPDIASMEKQIGSCRLFGLKRQSSMNAMKGGAECNQRRLSRCRYTSWVCGVL
jgi:hypothetical protein